MRDAPVLFHDPTSEPSRAVHWFALAAHVALGVHPIWLSRNEHLGAEFLAINPRHQVPALKHGDFCLSEATAIIRYLAEINGTAEEWLGATAVERARINQLLSWYHTNLRRRSTIEYFLPVLLGPSYCGFAPPPRELIEGLKTNVRAVLEEVEHFLGTALFLSGTRPTVPDLLFASEIFALDCDPERESHVAERTRLNPWLDRMRALPSYAVTHKQWNALVPHLRARLREEPAPGRDPSWVAAICERA
jgi:glutathione S-transferase